MTVTLVFFATLMATIVWWLIRQTADVQPWVADGDSRGLANTDHLHTSSIKVGLGVFLLVAASLFALFISAYMIRMEAGDWKMLDDPQILWANTAVLIIASLFFQRSYNAAQKQQFASMRNALLLAGFFTLVFLVGQLKAWQQLSAAGSYLSSNPANAFFYLFTAVHGLHLIGGLWVWGKAALSFGDAQSVRQRVELCTVYWHFLLVIWLILFTLLLNT